MTFKFSLLVCLAVILIGIFALAAGSQAQRNSSQHSASVPAEETTQSRPQRRMKEDFTYQRSSPSDEPDSSVLESDRWWVLLKDKFGTPNRWGTEPGAHYGYSDQFLGTLIAEWDGLSYTFEAQLPEKTKRSLAITPGHKITRSWFDAHKDQMIDPNLNIDYSADLDGRELFEEYVSKDQSLNAFVC